MYSSLSILLLCEILIYVFSFVDRDMFMCFRGGGVGHKMPQDLFELLRSDGASAENAENDFDFGRLEEEDDEEIDDEEMSCEDEDSEDEGNVDGNHDEEDVIVADEGEEFDDDYLAQEGYGTL